MGLPGEKKSKLAEKIADEVHKDWGSRLDDLKKREVGHQDAVEVVSEGISRAAERWRNDRFKERP